VTVRDLTNEPTTLRSATATGVIRLTPEGVRVIRDGRVEGGDPLGAARTSGLLAVKQTPFLLPHRHQVPVLDTRMTFELGEDQLTIEATVRAIASTGVATEALAAVAEAALCIRDLVEPHVADGLEITGLRLLDERGGRSQFTRSVRSARAAVLVLSDSVSSGAEPDTAGRSVVDGLDGAGFDVADFDVLPDDPERLTARLLELVEGRADLIVTVGGTGLGPRDRTVEAVAPLLTTELPGMMEAARSFGQDRTPYAMLSRGIAGLVGSTLVVTFPGSRRGAEETLAAILPGLVHLLDVLRTARPHDDGYG
jgi:molybdenum cofactor biosynthesis protein MoaC